MISAVWIISISHTTSKAYLKYIAFLYILIHRSITRSWFHSNESHSAHCPIKPFYILNFSCIRQSRFNAWHWMLGAGALGWPRGMVWGGRTEEGSGWGTRVYLWQIDFDIWQNQYHIVKLKNKKKFKKRLLKCTV